MTEDELDQLEAGLVRLKGGICVSSDLEVAAADAIARLRAELAAEREECLEQARLNGMGAERELKLMAERDALRALLREARIIVADEDRPRMDASELVARIDAALNKEGE